jgi:hypothetical protein
MGVVEKKISPFYFCWLYSKVLLYNCFLTTKVDDIVDLLNVVKDIALIFLIATKDAYQKLALFSPSPWDPKLARCIFKKN